MTMIRHPFTVPPAFMFCCPKLYASTDTNLQRRAIFCTSLECSVVSGYTSVLCFTCVQRLGCDQNRVVYMCKCDGKRQAQNGLPHAHLVLHVEAPCVFPLAYPKFTIRKGGVYYKLVLFQCSCKTSSVCGVFAFLQLFIFFIYLFYVCLCLDGEGGVVVHAR
ncbi:pQ706L 1 [African swine fever virus]|uniref:PQ706L 1 n=1 Tax=African swine fever virus TaxID=10497 RepID=A0A894KSV0_ASF|nr:pQ706L 1 [African swine fever virus]